MRTWFVNNGAPKSPAGDADQVPDVVQIIGQGATRVKL